MIKRFCDISKEMDIRNNSLKNNEKVSNENNSEKYIKIFNANYKLGDDVLLEYNLFDKFKNKYGVEYEIIDIKDDIYIIQDLNDGDTIKASKEDIKKSGLKIIEPIEAGLKKMLIDVKKDSKNDAKYTHISKNTKK